MLFDTFKLFFNFFLFFLVMNPSANLFGSVEDPSIFLTILARNKGHLLPLYLKCIDNLDYDKQRMTVYVNTNNNEDNTEEILNEWVKKHENDYKKVIFEKHDVDDVEPTKPHAWTPQRLRILGEIRDFSLDLAEENNCDFYFIVDCDNFIAPYTLKYLISKDKPIIAPLIKSLPEPGDPSSNFFGAVNEWGYYQSHPDYFKILNRSKLGTFKVPLVHCTYLIKSEYLNLLSYVNDTDEYEFIIFSRYARDNGVDQYICNEHLFGFQLHFYQEVTLEEERNRFKNIPIERLLQECTHSYENSIQ